LIERAIHQHLHKYSTRGVAAVGKMAQRHLAARIIRPAGAVAWQRNDAHKEWWLNALRLNGYKGARWQRRSRQQTSVWARSAVAVWRMDKRIFSRIFAHRVARWKSSVMYNTPYQNLIMSSSNGAGIALLLNAHAHAAARCASRHQ